MAEHARAWRRKLRIRELVDIAKKLESGTEMSQIYDHLDSVMVSKWKLIPSTRKQYMETVKKVLSNQYVC